MVTLADEPGTAVLTGALALPVRYGQCALPSKPVTPDHDEAQAMLLVGAVTFRVTVRIRLVALDDACPRNTLTQPLL